MLPMVGVSAVKVANEIPLRDNESFESSCWANKSPKEIMADIKRGVKMFKRRELKYR